MSNVRKTHGSDRPTRGDLLERGYQPQSATPIDPQNLKPPTGGSAIQPPKTPSEKK